MAIPYNSGLYNAFTHLVRLSLYSTATQNTWRRGLALGNAPDARIMRQLTQKIPTCWYLKTRKHPTPNLKILMCVTQRETQTQVSGIYGLRWVLNAKFLLGMYISCCLCQFHLHLGANANAFFSGIWALMYLTSFTAGSASYCS